MATLNFLAGGFCTLSSFGSQARPSSSRTSASGSIKLYSRSTCRLVWRTRCSQNTALSKLVTGKQPVTLQRSAFFGLDVCSTDWRQGTGLGRLGRAKQQKTLAKLNFQGGHSHAKQGSIPQNGVEGLVTLLSRKDDEPAHPVDDLEESDSKDKFLSLTGNAYERSCRFVGLVALLSLCSLVAASAAQAAGATAPAPAKKEGKKSKKAPKNVVTLQERYKWTSNLPAVQETVPYSQLLDLGRQGKIKHIIKHPEAKLKADVDKVLVVLEDDRVVRSVLPLPAGDPAFWPAWRRLRLDQKVIDAYSPAQPPAGEEWSRLRANEGPSFLWAAKFFADLTLRLGDTWGLVNEKVLAPLLSMLLTPFKLVLQLREKLMAAPAATAAKKAGREKQAGTRSKELRLERLAREREARERERRLQKQQLKEEQRDRARAIRNERIVTQKERKVLQKMEDQALRWQEQADEVAASNAKIERLSRKKERELQRQALTSLFWSSTWTNLAENPEVQYIGGIIMMVAFYNLVVVRIKKSKKDYDDRQKLLEAEDKERQAEKDWVKQMSLQEQLDSKAKKADKGAASAEGEEGKGKGEEQEEEEAAEAEEDDLTRISKRFLSSGARRKFKPRGKPQYMDTSADVTFDDVAGLGQIRWELEEVVEFFINAAKYERRGARVPSGILLCGAPGVGKTLLAKAVAGEAGVSFFSVSASQFVEIYAGVGSSRVRALYAEARAYAPSVVFIDELDAVGRQRGMTKGSGAQERDATLNQLLTCLDGFEKQKGEVITIAATNRPDILDAALVRPGRFDRKIVIPRPSFAGRAQILQVHARNLKMAPDVDWPALAQATAGMVGAQLASVMKTATLRAFRAGLTQIGTQDVFDAILQETVGSSRIHMRKEEEMRIIAFHEAASAVCCHNTTNFNRIYSIDIQPREEEARGRIRFVPHDIDRMRLQAYNKQTLLDQMMYFCAPRAIEELCNDFEDVTTHTSDSLNEARTLARVLVTHGFPEWADLGGYGDTFMPVEDMESIDQRAAEVFSEQFERAKQILIRNQEFVEVLVDVLLEKKLIEGPEFQALAHEFGVTDPKPADAVHNYRRSMQEYQELMLASGLAPSREVLATAS